MTQHRIKVHLSRIMGERRINIAKLAEKTNLHRNAISRLYNETTDGIRFDTLTKLCKALECDITDILEYVPDEE